MEPVLTPSIVKRLREGTGADVLEHLDLSNGLLVPRELDVVADAILTYSSNAGGACSPLQSIDLTGNLICGLDEHSDGEYDCSGFEMFIRALLIDGDKRPIRKLVLHRNNLGREGCTILSQLFGPAMPVFLHEISLRCCNIDNVGLRHLLTNFETCKTLHYLDLRQNDFGREGAELLGEVLGKQKYLRRLDISHNFIGSQGCAAFCEKLTQNVSLQIVSMIECGLGDEGAKAIGAMLKNNTGISHLDLQENGFTDPGVTDIAQGLSKNRTLVFLGLQHNEIGDEGVTSLGRALHGNNVFKTLFVLGNNRITETGINECVAQMKWSEDKQVMLDMHYVFPVPAPPLV